MPGAISNIQTHLLFVSQPLRRICQELIGNPLFLTAYGSAGEHHSYEGGLAVHTSEVVDYAFQMADMFPDCDREALVVAAVFHDFMKIYEYDPIIGSESRKTLFIRKTPYRNLVRHVAGSHAEFVSTTAHLSDEVLSSDRRLKIEHAILAHHGRKEWGSPIEPQLVEAFILHFADQFSVKFGAQKTYKVVDKITSP